MDGVGPESLDITEKSLFSHVFSFVFIWNPRPHCAGSNFLGRKEGRMAQPTHLLFTVTVDFAVPQQKQCPFGNQSLQERSSQSSTVTPELSHLPVGGVQTGWNILYQQKNPKHPPGSDYGLSS